VQEHFFKNTKHKKLWNKSLKSCHIILHTWTINALFAGITIMYVQTLYLQAKKLSIVIYFKNTETQDETGSFICAFTCKDENAG